MTQAMFPPADWLGNGQSGGTYVTGIPWRVVLHTTETEGLPSYDDGASAPHLTYDPNFRLWYQHTNLLTAARALRNETFGTETNRFRALQVEIVCYSDKGTADADPSDRTWVGNLSAVALADIRKFLEWTFTHFGVKDMWPGKQALSYSEANKPGFRMTFNEWTDFGGVCAHQHVPENTHWDTGALDWSAIIKPREEEDTMYPMTLKDGTKNQRPDKAEDIKYLQAKMNLYGVLPKVKVDGTVNQAMLDKFFEIVGSPAGGTFISGAEAAVFDHMFAQANTVDKRARSKANLAHKRLNSLRDFDF